MAIETWDSPYIVIWLYLSILAVVLLFGVRGYSDKVEWVRSSGIWYVDNNTVRIEWSSIRAIYMYDDEAKI